MGGRWNCLVGGFALHCCPSGGQDYLRHPGPVEGSEGADAVDCAAILAVDWAGQACVGDSTAARPASAQTCWPRGREVSARRPAAPTQLSRTLSSLGNLTTATSAALPSA